MTPQRPILRPQETCWRLERAERMAVIIDAADYFALVKQAILGARHSVMLIAWDFDARIRLDPSAPRGKAPDRLGRFLNWVVSSRPDLEIRVLKWDLGAVKALGRGMTPLFVLDWITDARMHFRLDGAHPMASVHHQKVVVIDDALAFCGGIDMTADRWDTRDHLDEDPRRRRPTTRRSYGPWHDVTTAVNGPAARALGDLARERWEQATGERLDPPPACTSRWLDGLEPLVEDVEVGISRTVPDYGDRPGVHEIEALYLEAIARTERCLYIESQYFASRRLAEAMADRLGEPDGPEIVVVNPLTANGWLEESVMGASRARLLGMLAEADRFDRFRIYYPVTLKGEAIYVHAKVLTMDDRLLKVGSSNLNNRSMGFDTECDLSVEAGPEETGLQERILALRDDLISEHLGVQRSGFQQTLAAKGSLIAAIEAMRSPGRSLRPFEPPELGVVGEKIIADNDLLDPERVSSIWSSRRAPRLKRAP
ncbi:phospholipase D-like domain-containing protein [Cereibacter sphaeroides]|uniref:phospholipase D-like domain-containing protein n=1 Tax=Cereibacter sphaeroides TaxID=1063 RepID=UPI001F3E7013|nr:phospholipase D-like domain-containing protein [Cereibacter sphaeroides]MCE6961858.1 phospholipase D-like domain-containing protein [Cereibacter sphaeroides]MCE6970633.1 phospholipase D-like domain-containing protein [Cereibacter sphaeroides]MCE6975771.1 phospholipase D-like domain-containing protein [Cereibacter sphaeroides]